MTEKEVMKLQLPVQSTIYLTEENKSELSKLYDKIDDGADWATIEKALNKNKKLTADDRQRDIAWGNLVNYYQDN